MPVGRRPVRPGTTATAVGAVLRAGVLALLLLATSGVPGHAQGVPSAPAQALADTLGPASFARALMAYALRTGSGQAIVAADPKILEDTVTEAAGRHQAAWNRNLAAAWQGALPEPLLRSLAYERPPSPEAMAAMRSRQEAVGTRMQAMSKDIVAATLQEALLNGLRRAGISN